MSNAAHTPGPWSLHRYHTGRGMRVASGVDETPWISWQFAIGAGDSIVGTIEGYSVSAGYPRPDNREEVRANALICSAAPEMLEALKEVAEMVAAWECADGPCIQGSVMNEVKAAIAKAEGGAL